MKNISVLLILLLHFFIANAQISHYILCHENPLQQGSFGAGFTNPDTLDASLKQQLIRWDQNEDFQRTMVVLQEPSTVTSLATWTIMDLGYQKKNFILDSDLQLPIAIGGKRFGLNHVQVIPRFQVRIFQDDIQVPFGPKGDYSLPVRTPSAMPGIAYYRSFRQWWKNVNAPRWFTGLYVFHHSNGQDGSEIDTVRRPGEVNIYNGNFSENVIAEFIVGGKWTLGRTDLLISPENRALRNAAKPGDLLYFKTQKKWDLYWRIGYEWHPKSLSNSVFDSLGMYGRHRINVRVGLIRIRNLMEYIKGTDTFCMLKPETAFEQFRVTLNMNYIADTRYNRGNTFSLDRIAQFNLKRRLNLWASFYYILGKSKHSALFAQAGYFGSDTYNIYFNQSMWHVKAGFSFAFFDQHYEPLITN
ncbi:hypothetical protein ACFPMF_26355 [Larkinella bovis]|uniref:Uncharacterized protein n=1 Tax=Larkinella bovis TaxID=683041 RepID=A0ABW0IH91_9BACT